MKQIVFNKVKRCCKCGHLINAALEECPYCAGTVHARHYEFAEKKADEESPRPPRKPMSPETKKKLMWGGIAVVIIIAAVFGISKYLETRLINRSVTEELTYEEVGKIEEKYPAFTECYMQLSTIDRSSIADSLKDLTYLDMYEYYNKLNDGDFVSEVYIEAENSYENDVHSKYKQSVDSIIGKWEEYITAHNPELYIKMKPETSYYSDGWSSHPAFSLSYVTKNDSVAEYSITFYPVSDATGEKLSWANKETLGSSEIPFAPNVRYYTSRYGTDFWDDNSLKCETAYVRLNDGTEYFISDMNNVPASVKAYIEDKNTDNETRMIRAELDPDYKTVDQYQAFRYDKALKDFNPLAYDLWSEIVLDYYEDEPEEGY